MSVPSCDVSPAEIGAFVLGAAGFVLGFGAVASSTGYVGGIFFLVAMVTSFLFHILEYVYVSYSLLLR